MIPIGPFRKVPMGGGAKLHPYLPLVITPSFLELYLDSRLGTSGFANGANVNLLPDQSGHSPARDAITNLVDPTMGRSGVSLTPNSVATINFRGNNDAQGLQGRTQFNWPAITTRGYTLYWYGLTEQKTVGPYSLVNQVVFAGDPANWHTQHVLNSGGGTASCGLVDDAGGGAPKRFVLSANIVNKWQLHTLVLPSPNNNTVAARYYINGVQQSQIGGGATYQCSQTGVSSYFLGNTGGFNVAFRGNIGAYFLYSTTHSVGTIGLFATWADVFFGLT